VRQNDETDERNGTHENAELTRRTELTTTAGLTRKRERAGNETAATKSSPPFALSRQFTFSR